jgi:hypothetical protein
MSIFGNIVSAIFGSKEAKIEPTGGARPPSDSASWTTSTAAAPGSAPASGSISHGDVEAQIARIAQSRGGQYNWQTSIVDLMKLLELDSSLGARKQLAQELGYKDALDGSAEMNIWLHKQVMDKLAESGGKVPESLKH